MTNVEDNNTPSISKDEIKGMLIALDFTAPCYEKAAKVLYSDKRDAGYIDMVNECITTKTDSRFDVYKN